MLGNEQIFSVVLGAKHESAGETKGKKIIGIQRQKIWNRKGQGSTDTCCSLALILKLEMELELKTL